MLMRQTQCLKRVVINLKHFRFEAIREKEQTKTRTRRVADAIKSELR